MTDLSGARQVAPATAALRHSHDRLRVLTEPLDAEQLAGRSYASEWSIAQVLSHLGSGAEIFGLLLDAGLRGEEPPGRETFTSLWDMWNARSPEEQASEALAADRTLVERLEELGNSQGRRFVVKLFGREVDTDGFVRARLAEHAIHTWDVAVALNPTATVAGDAVELLVDELSRVASYSGKSTGGVRRIGVVTTDPARQFVVDIGDSVALLAGGGDDLLSALTLPAEAFIRLVYGRLDPAHTPQLEADDGDLDELRAIFPGV